MRFNLPAWRPALALFVVFATGCASQVGHPVGPGSVHSRKPELHQAVDANDEKRVRDLLASGADVNTTGITGETALHHAVWAGNLSIAGLLLSAGANPNARDIMGGTALRSAAMDGNLEMVTLLVNQGSDVNDPRAAGEYGMETPLHSAVMRGHVPVARFLIEHGADIRAKNGLGATPLQTAASSSRSGPVELLLAKGAADGVKNQEAEDILERACSSTELLPLVRTMLGKGADVNVRFSGGISNTPLHKAASFSPEISELLVEKGAKIDARDLSGKTPLHMAAFSGNDRTVAFLLASGAPVDARDLAGGTPLHLAVKMGKERTVAILLDQGADINARTKGGKTPLRIAVEENNIGLNYGGLIKYLRERGARE